MLKVTSLVDSTTIFSAHILRDDDITLTLIFFGPVVNVHLKVVTD